MRKGCQMFTRMINKKLIFFLSKFFWIPLFCFCCFLFFFFFPLPAIQTISVHMFTKMLVLFWYVFALSVPCRYFGSAAWLPTEGEWEALQKETVALICSLEEPVFLHLVQRKPLEMSLTLQLQNTLKNVACHCPSDLTSLLIISIYFSIHNPECLAPVLTSPLLSASHSSL